MINHMGISPHTVLRLGFVQDSNFQIRFFKKIFLSMKVFDSSLIEIFLVSSSFLLNDIIFRSFRSCIQFKCRYFRILTSFNKNKNRYLFTYLSSQTPKCFTHPMSSVFGVVSKENHIII